MKAFDDCILAISADQVLRGQGIDPTGASTRLPALRAAAARTLAECRHLLDPRVVLSRRPVTALDDTAVRLAGGTAIEDPGVAARLRGSSEVVFVVCTVGEAISRRAADALAHDPAAALAIDGLACAGVDALAADVCDRERRRAAESGHLVTPPLSPGTDEWPLPEGQRAIFGVVDAASIGVRLSESCQMRPTKSASFILGAGARVWQDDGGSCARCGARERCAWRLAATG